MIVQHLNSDECGVPNCDLAILVTDFRPNGSGHAVGVTHHQEVLRWNFDDFNPETSLDGTRFILAENMSLSRYADDATANTDLKQQVLELCRDHFGSL